MGPDSFSDVNQEQVQTRDVARLFVPRCGQLASTGDLDEPYRLIDAGGAVVEPVAVFLRELLAAGRSPATLRSYGMDLMRWWRFLGAVDVGWHRATRAEARDFSCWIQLAVKHRRRPLPDRVIATVEAVGAPNTVTGKPALGPGYAPATIAHSETVLRGFYDFQRDIGAGPILNPFPLELKRGRWLPGHRAQLHPYLERSHRSRLKPCSPTWTDSRMPTISPLPLCAGISATLLAWAHPV